MDLYLPELKLAFEYNGIFWHSDKYKENKYHLNKTNDCQKLGIKLIHIWEDDWIHKNQIVRSRILNLLWKTPTIIYARKCEIKEVNYLETKEFLEMNHIQGHCTSKINMGLYLNDELLSIMTFGNLRSNLGHSSKKDQFELLRFCNKIKTSVVGGASKLLKSFINRHKPTSIISYSDRSWPNGSLYRKIGFEKIGETQPNYFWVVNGKRRNRYNFRKDVLVKEGFDKSKSESQIMKERGYHKIYDSGSLKFEIIPT